MLAPVTHILPLTHIRRKRLLPSVGRVLVRTNQKVSATDAVAEAVLDGKHQLINVRRALGLGSAREAERAIERKVGEKVQKGDILAQVGSILRRIVRAPADGQIVAINGGQVLLEVEQNTFILRAGFSGVITEIISERGVVIETDGVLAQGVWGNDRIEQGVLLALTEQADEELTKDRLDVSMRGAVLLAGFCAQEDVLRMGVELTLRGLILGSMKADLLPLAQSLKFPVIVLEGFGRMAMDSIAFKALSSNGHRDVSLNSVHWDRYTGNRPEVVISLPAEGSTAPESDNFQPEQTVRILMPPYAGRIGVLLQVRPGLTQLPSGLRTQAADVRLENQEVVSIPLANLDVLE